MMTAALNQFANNSKAFIPNNGAGSTNLYDLSMKQVQVPNYTPFKGVMPQHPYQVSFQSKITV